jgi:hypothetical protein
MAEIFDGRKSMVLGGSRGMGRHTAILNVDGGIVAGRN